MAGDGSERYGWVAELRRRKVFRVAGAYLVVAWLLVQVAATTFEPMGLPGWTVKLVIILAALGFPFACALAWAFDVTPGGIERTPPAGHAVAAERPAIAAAGDAAPAPTRESVAILPFLDMSPGRDQEYFCDGIAEEIINSIGCIRGLRVASRTSSFQFKGRAADVREIGRSLRVDAVLDGSVRKAGDRVRITAQLVSAADGYNIWSESFDRNLEDVFAIQSEIAERLVKALRVALTPQENALLVRGGTRNAEAYDLYLRGQQLMREYHSSSVGPAAMLFRQAIARDAAFAQAHAGLANAIAAAAFCGLPTSEADWQEALTACNRALALESHMPEAYVARGCVMSMQGRAAEAERDFDEAIRLNPASAEALYLYGRHCFAAGQFEKSIDLYRAALRLEPDSYQISAMLCLPLEKLGREGEMRREQEYCVQAVEKRLQGDPRDMRALYLGACIAARLGNHARGTELADIALATSPGDPSTTYNVACAFALMGNRERALELLERAATGGSASFRWIRQDPDLESLHGDPRFEAVLARVSS